MNESHPTRRLAGIVADVSPVSASMFELRLELEADTGFRPGQFAMLNLGDGPGMTLPRPFSIHRADGRVVSLLFKAVGTGTRRLADCRPGAAVVYLGPLGRPFPAPAPGDPPRLLLAGGVGLPPLLAWRRVHGRDGDLNLCGGRDGADLPWNLLGGDWDCSVDRAVDLPAGRTALTGTVIDLARARLADGGDEVRHVLACGPLPLLRAARDLARERGWPCHVSVEERMGCGYGVCRGCVVPRPGEAGWATACQDGPVLPAEDVDWERFGRANRGAPPVSACGERRDDAGGDA